MFCQEGHKIGRRILRAHAHSQSLVFQRESDRGTSDFLKTVLSNRRPASIASRVSQENVWIEKSRDLMVSWACVAYLTLKAMTIPGCGVLFQTQKENKAIQLVEYAKCLYCRQPDFLRKAFPLTKPTRDQPALSLHFAHGGYVLGIPGGADQIRSYHPYGYLNDESSFQPEAGECYNEALSAVKGKIIFNSSAGPGWYADARHDIIRNVED